MSDSDIDTGHEDYAAGNEAYGHEQDHAENFGQFDQTHVQEHDVHYQHVHHVEFDDGHGGHYEVDDYTEYSEHDVQIDTTHAAQLAENDHELTYQDETFVERVHDFISGEWLQGNQLGGSDLNGTDLHGADLSDGHELHGPERSDSGHATDGLSEVST